MAGEHQIAQRVLDDALASLREDAGANEDSFTRALMSRLLEEYGKRRSAADIVSELEHHIRSLEDGGHPVVTRGC